MCDRNTDYIEERRALSMERIRQVKEEHTVPAPFDDYFRTLAGLICMGKGMEEDILPEHYAASCANPAAASVHLGHEYGPPLCFLQAQMMRLPRLLEENRTEAAVLHLELFLEVYNRFEQVPLPTGREVERTLYWFVLDTLDPLLEERTEEILRTGPGPECADRESEFAFDHREDAALYLDRRFAGRFTAALQRAERRPGKEPGERREEAALRQNVRRPEPGTEAPAFAAKKEALAFTESQRGLRETLMKAIWEGLI